ncbi:MAG: glycosyltransferase family 2 protein [Candidatus Marinimicrobia bacterium]|nr:glycosyltransferase family 2 protein [Candidatus Neomarinimicrobiota bacterium]
MYKLVISIVTYNSARVIEKCISSILSQNYNNYKIVVFDNNSSDNTYELIERFKDSRFELIKSDINLGYCGGHNFVINNTSSEYILLVNPDVIMLPNYIHNALNIMDQDSSIGTLCGLLLQNCINDTHCIIDGAGLNLNKDRTFSLRYHNRELGEVDLYTEEVAGADGALPLYRRKMIEDIKINGNFFDSSFFMHKEDWDVSWRSIHRGWKTVFAPQCIAIHPRTFRKDNRENIDDYLKYHSKKNELVVLFSNEYFVNILLDIVFIVCRMFQTLLYTIIFEPRTIRYINYIIKNIHYVYKRRKIILRRSIQKPTLIREIIFRKKYNN